jgi:DnaJ homolog subfamily C member 7
MVLRGLFSKKKPSDDDLVNSPDADRSPRAPSPSKKSLKKSQSTSRDSRPGSARSSSSRSPTKSSPRFPYDRNSHPLNLPPEQRQRLSAAMSDPPTPMDIDYDGPSPAAVPVPSSPPPQSPQPPQPSQLPQSMPGALNMTGNANGDGSPVPPPHRKQTSPPPPLADAEAFKAAGNKFFKTKDYEQAIIEYTKGAFSSSVAGRKRVPLN